MMNQAWIPYCGTAPEPGRWLLQWNFDPALLVVLLGATGLAVWRSNGAGRKAAMAAIAVVTIAFVSPLCALSSALFTARTLHHLLLVLAVAPLIALALPIPRRARLISAVAAHAAVFWSWHAPGAYAAALSHDSVYWLMQITILASATWFWRAIRASAAPAAIAGLLAAMLSMGLLGALLTFAGQPLYAPHFATTLAWGFTPLEDQQGAGLIMWAPAALGYMVAALWRLNSLLSVRQISPA